MRSLPKRQTKQIETLVVQLGLDLSLVMQEIGWALGEERINRVTPSYEEFRRWQRRKDGLIQFWDFAKSRLETDLTQDDVQDIWNCIDLTLNARKRRPFTFQEYLMIAIRSDQVCEICGKRPPEVNLDIDHILPVKMGGSETAFNLRFLCEYHNRSRGARFRWADIWRRL